MIKSIRRYRCMARQQSAGVAGWPPCDPYPQQLGGQQQMPAVSCLKRRRKLNTDLSITNLPEIIICWRFCAIKLALQWVISNSDKNVSIFSDSYSSLQAIASGKSNCRPNLLLQVIGLVSKYTKNVDFVWLPSHIGIKGNELADKLANAATAKPSIDVNIGLELSEAYTLIDRYILGKWQHLWEQEPRGSHYRSVEKKRSPTRSNTFTHPGTPRSSWAGFDLANVTWMLICIRLESIRMASATTAINQKLSLIF